MNPSNCRISRSRAWHQAGAFVLGAGFVAALGATSRFSAAIEGDIEERVSKVEAWIKAEDIRRERETLNVLRRLGQSVQLYASENRDQFAPNLRAMKPADEGLVLYSPYSPRQWSDYDLLPNPCAKLADVFFPSGYLLAFDRAAREQGRDNVPVLLCWGTSQTIPEQTLKTVESIRALAIAARIKTRAAWNERLEAAFFRPGTAKEAVAVVKAAAASGEWTPEAQRAVNMRWQVAECELIQPLAPKPAVK